MIIAEQQCSEKAVHKGHWWDNAGKKVFCNGVRVVVSRAPWKRQPGGEQMTGHSGEAH